MSPLFCLLHFFSLRTCNSISLVCFFLVYYYLSCFSFIETGSDDDGNIDVSEDDFFMDGSSSDEDADDEWTDKSARYNVLVSSSFSIDVSCCSLAYYLNKMLAC